MMELKARPLKFESLEGISAKQLSEHHDVLYVGYVKKVNEIRQKLEATDRAAANATYSDYRELKLEEAFAVNAVRLHEAYFDNLGGDGRANGDILTLIERDFGSFDAWKNDMTAAGIAARGWVVTALDFEDGHLHNYICDAHNLGCIWNCSALIVLDVYEHAYFIDYATGRKSYLEAFFKNLDFAAVNSLIREQNLNESERVGLMK